MSRLIDADKLKNTLLDLEVTGCRNKTIQKAMQDVLDYFMPLIIDDEPTVDVHCPNCGSKIGSDY